MFLSRLSPTTRFIALDHALRYVMGGVIAECQAEQDEVYPQDAERIVSLLDINLPPPPSTLPTSAPPAFEILEAGTGNGALSLFLARALHAANPPPPPSPSPFSNVRNPVFSNPEAEAQWRGSRRAVLYTLDNNSARSAHAAGLIRGFRGGLYAGHVDLHVSDPNTWLAAEHTRRGDEAPFLAHAILDLPAPEAHVAAVGRALRPNGRLVMFVPSVTQLKACWDVVKQHGLPLWHENVFELCAGWTGGREWDVRPTRVRRKSATGAGEAGTEGRMQPAEVELGGEDLQQTDAGSATEGTDADELESASQGGAPPASDSADDTDADGQVWVCRPRVGAMVRGGGFLGVWQKRVNS